MGLARDLLEETNPPNLATQRPYPASTLHDLADQLGLHPHRLTTHLGIPDTLLHDPTTPLHPEYAHRIHTFVRLLDTAITAHQHTPKQAAAWLFTPHPALHDLTPASLARTPRGRREVAALLDATAARAAA